MKSFPSLRKFPQPQGRGGFTLVELLAATAILLVVIFVLLEVITSMTSIWHDSTGTIANFQSARGAFNTINHELARATLKTYLDYTNDPTQNNKPFGQFRTSLSAAQQQSFVPAAFARASDLHFICGPAGQVLPSGTTPANNPGDAAFFQAPLGAVGETNAASDKYLQRTLNDVGLYVQYSDLAPSFFPGWLYSFFGGAAHYRFRVVECVEPTENLSIYGQTATGSYSTGWIPPASAAIFPVSNTTYNESVLAEDVVLLIFRPRLESADEQVIAGKVGTTYGATTQNSIISPNYAYDSRAWQPGYSYATGHVENTSYALYMRNQLPPIVDVAMVCIDPNSLAHFQLSTQATPPAMLQPAAGLFTNSANMDADLGAFGQQLTANHLRYRIFRSAVQMQTAAWADE
jgi:uncharacterized protein (TIGR02599 family)